MQKINKPIRSFVNRARKLSLKKQQVIDQIGNKYLLIPSQKSVEFAETFARKAPLIIEIGFGMGESLLFLAQTMSDKNFLGIEVHKPGIASILTQLQQNPLQNIRIYECDAVEIFKNCIKNESVDGIILYFPDPWSKRRHHKRRIIQKEFANLLALKLKSKGKLQITTDCDDYAKHCIKILSAISSFTNYSNITTEDYKQYMFEPYQTAATKFRQRGIKLGHKISDLVFVKN